MRIAVIGSGGVGGYFGGLLAASGQDVVFVARGAHLAALQSQGLTIDSPVRPLKNQPVRAVASLVGEAPADLVLIAVKLWDTEQAIAAAKPVIGAETAVASLQNGIAAPDLVKAAFGPDHTLGGVAQISAEIAAPGVIRHVGAMARMLLGEFDRRQSERLQRISEAARAAGFDFISSLNINFAIWEKFVYLSSFSGITALTRKGIGPIMAEPKTAALFEAALREASAVAAARGAAMPDGHVEKVLAFARTRPPETRSSMAGDLERGARLELPWLSGTIAAHGRQLGIPTPTHEFFEAALTLHAMGNQRPA